VDIRNYIFNGAFFGVLHSMSARL